MLEVFVWILLFLLLGGAVLLLRYWTDLIRRQDTYHRTELVDFPSILLGEIRIIAGEGWSGYAAAAMGILFAWLITLLGGLLSPDTGPEPDWTASQLPNYFFQSAGTVLMAHLAWPAVRALLAPTMGKGILADFLASDNSFLWGLSVSLASISLAAWGVDHQMSFLFVGINGALLLGYAVYRLNLSAHSQQTEARSSEADPFETGKASTGDGLDNPDEFSFLDEARGGPAATGHRNDTEF